MRVCSSCGRENPDDRDFCECGEYLRWDPTGVVQAVTPEVLQAAQDQAPPPAAEPPAAPQQPAQPAAAEPAPPPAAACRTRAARPAAPPAPASPANGAGDPLAPAPPRRRPPPPRPPPPAPAPAAPPPATLEQPVAPPPPAAPAQPAEPDPAAISLRLPEGEQVQPRRDARRSASSPAAATRVLALVRNQSGIVDNYELSVRGLPGRLVVDLPEHRLPRAVRHQRHVRAGGGDPPPPAAHAEAEARIWELEVVGESKAYNRQAAAAPLKLGIQPFEEFKTKLAPERASGRKKAQLRRRGQEHGQRARHRRARRRRPGQRARLRVHPGDDGDPAGPVGHVEDAGQAAAQALDRAPGGEAHPGLHQDRRGGRAGQDARRTWSCPRARAKRARRARQGAAAAEMGKAQAAPRASRGPRAAGRHRAACGCRARASPSRACPSKNVDLMKLKAPGGGAPTPQMPLMPNQVVFRHKAWLPWWVALLIPLLLLLALLLFLFLPKNVVVPEVTGAKSAFEAEKKLDRGRAQARRRDEAEGLHGGAARHRDRPDARPPARRRRRTPRSRSRSRSATARSRCPTWSARPRPKRTRSCARRTSRSARCQPQPPDPKAKISSQIPAAKEIVKEGTPIAIFTGRPARQEEGRGQGRQEERRQGGGGGGKAAAAALPALAGCRWPRPRRRRPRPALVPEKVTSSPARRRAR